ncbi:MAG: hypothetical protein V1911_01205 [Candidatus Micrarchaeota archaeon]
MKPGRSRGQIISIDLMVAMVIVIGLTAMMSFQWSNYRNTLNANEKTLDMQAAALKASSELVFSEGSPKNWDSGDVILPGIAAGKPYIIDNEKVGQLMLLSDGQLPEYFGIEKYKMYITMSQAGGAEIFHKGERPENPHFTASSNGFAVYNSEVVKIDVQVWI